MGRLPSQFCDSYPPPVTKARRDSAWLKALGILLCLLAGASATAQSKAKNVLILFSSVDQNPHFGEVAEHEIRRRVSEPINFYLAYLSHLNANPDEPGPSDQQRLFEDSQAETFRRTYAGVKLDLVIAVSPQALIFAVHYRDKVFPGVPIVFTQVGTREFQGKTWPGVTGLTVPVGIGETIDLALRLHPDTTTVAIIQGQDWFWIGVAQSELSRYKNVKTIVFNDDPSPELLAKVRALPPHTLVLFHLALSDASHPEFGTRDLLAGVAARWPTYSAWPENCLNYGCIGGAYPDLNKEHLETAHIAARILSGQKPENIPTVKDASLQVQVDWRQLQRWHIPVAALPKDSVLLYREPTVWERYRDLILVVIAVMLAQASLIAALLRQRARKRKAEAILRESEERFRLLANTTPALIWMFDTEGKINYLNDRRVAFTGPDQNAGYGDSWTRLVHPEDLPGVADTVAKCLNTHQPFSMEYRLRRFDGVYRWMYGIASPRTDRRGAFAGFIGSSIDITDQKLARETLRKFSGYLLEAQEKERTRIARELHDDVCQRLALLSLEIHQVSRVSNGSSGKLEEIRKQCYEIARDVQAVSHRLHSSKLDYLGVVAALKGFCEEFSQKFETTVDFVDTDVPANVPHDISLCLFRVTQEALRNAVKYSDTHRFLVTLAGTANGIRLEVKDWGAGFDLEAAQRKHGLGLVSMQERVHLVRGQFSIESWPGKGTKIIVTVPLSPQQKTSTSVEAFAVTSSEKGTG